jgi:hypothetical protein
LDDNFSFFAYFCFCHKKEVWNLLKWKSFKEIKIFWTKHRKYY